MALYAPVETSDFVLAPAGPHAAICCDVVDLGELEETWNGQTKIKHKIFISWLIDEAGDDGRPHIVSKRYTLSMHENSNLYADICAWLGMQMTEEQAARCDVEKMIGKTCMMNIVHTTRPNGKTYANVQSIMPLPRGAAVVQIGDYKRHINRSAEENPKDVRNPALSQTSSQNGQQQANGYHQQPAQQQMPPAPPPQADLYAAPPQQQHAPQAAYADTFAPNDDLPF